MECLVFVLIAPISLSKRVEDVFFKFSFSLLCRLFDRLSLSSNLEFLGDFVLPSSTKDCTDELLVDFLGDGDESERFAAAALRRDVRVVLIGTEVEAVLRFSSEEDLR